MKREVSNILFLCLLSILLLSSLSLASANILTDISDGASSIGDTIGNFFKKVFLGPSDDSVGVQGALTSASRTMPATYIAGIDVPVSITLTFDPSDCGGAYVETLPLGWNASSITGSGSGFYNPSLNTITWAPIDGALCGGTNSYVLTYNATPDLTQSGVKTFSGQFSVDGNSYSVLGSSTITSGSTPFDYSLSAPAVTVTQGSTATQTVTVTRTQGTAQLVTVTINPLPTGVTLTSSNAQSCTPTSGSCSVTFTYSASASASAGTTSVGIIGATVGLANKISSFSLTVNSVPTYTLSVVKAGTGSGTVTSNPTGINCGSTCSSSFAQGTSVTLTASPLAGSTFTGWSGACSGTGTCVVTMDAVKSVTATFTLIPFDYSLSAPAVTVTQSSTATQTVTVTQTQGTAQPVTVNVGTLPTGVTLTSSNAQSCTPSSGSCSVTFTYSASASASAGTTSIPITATSSGVTTKSSSFSLTVNSIPTYMLTVGKSGTGSGTVTSSPAGINCGSSCSLNFNSGSSVTLTASPLAGSTFAGWSGACSGTGTCVVTMDAVKSVTATFTLIPFDYSLSAPAVTVTQSSTATQTVTVTQTQGTAQPVTVNVGTLPTGVTLTSSNAQSCTPSSGSCSVTFTYSASASASAGTTSIPITATSSGVTTKSSSFSLTVSAIPTYTLSVVKAGTGSGTVTSNPTGINCGSTCTSNFNSGSSVTLTASPLAGSTFAGWSGACSGTGTCTVAMNSAQSVTATFTLIPFDYSLSAPAVTVTQSSTATQTVTVTQTQGTAQLVSVTVTTLPTGVTLTSSNAQSCTPSSGSCSVTFTYSASASASAGTTSVGIIGATVGLANKISSFSLTVNSVPTNTLNIVKAGTGSGTVTSNPTGINCGSTCSSSFAQGTSVTLTASPLAGSTFTGWNGACAEGSVSSKSLVAYWQFNQSSGTSVADASGNGNNLALIGNPIFVSGKLGNAISFDGIDDSASEPAINLAGTNNFTIAAWTNFSTLPGIVFETTNNYNNFNTGAMVVGNTGTAPCAGLGTQLIEVAINGNVGRSQKCYNYPGNGLHHYAVVFNKAASAANEIEFYVDGVLQTAIVGGGSSNENTNTFGNDPVYLMSRGGTGIFTAGTLDEVRIYNRSLTLNEVQEVNNSDFPVAIGTCTVAMNSAQSVTATFTLIPFDYSLSAPAVTVTQGSTATQTVTVTQTQGTAQPVTVNVGTLPTGVTLTSSNAQSCTPTSGSCSVTFTYAASLSASATTTQINFNGTSSGVTTKSGTFQLTVSAIPTYTLSVVKAGTGSGTVTSNPTGINCGSTCSLGFNSGSSVTLTASPLAGSTFAGWSGACSGTGTCTVAMNSAQSVTATFTLIPFDYSLSAPAVTVTQGSTGSHTVTITRTQGTAQPVTVNVGTLPTGVTLTSSNAQSCTPTSGSCSVTFTYAASLSASATTTQINFNGTSSGVTTKSGTFQLTVSAIPTYTLSVVKAGTGSGTVTSNPTGINCGSTCSLGFNSGSSVTLTASPLAGSTFAGWSGACSGTGTCTVAMNSAQSVTATFTLIPFDYSISNGGSRTVNQSSSNTQTITTNYISGSGTVTFSTIGLPTGASAIYTPNSCALSSTTTTCSTVMNITANSSTSIGNYNIIVSATSGSTQKNSTFVLTVALGGGGTSVFNYSISNGGSRTVTQSSTVSQTASLSRISGSGTVTFSTTGLPTGASATYTPNSCALSSTTTTCSSTMNIITSALTPAGSYTVTVSATSGSTQKNSTFSLTVNSLVSVRSAVRSLPLNYNPGVTLPVSITLTLDPNDCGVAYVESVPAGFNVSGVTGAGSGYYNSLLNNITWAPIDGPLCGGTSSYVLSYNVTPNMTQSGTKTFFNQFSIDGTTYPVTGSNTISSGSVAFDYSTNNAGAKSVTAGLNVTESVSVNLISGSGTVTFSTTGLPTGASATYTPNSCALSSTTTTCSSTMNIITSALTPAGSYTVTVSATSGSTQKNSTFVLTVSNISSGPFVFSMSNTGDIAVVKGNSVTKLIDSNLVSGVARNVSFKVVSALPAEITTSLSPSVCTPSCTTTLTISTASGALTGTYQIIVNGTGSTYNSSTSFNLVVNNPKPGGGNNGGGSGGSSCTNECTSGTKQCYLSGARVCGNYDSDSCYEWSNIANCSASQTCINGVCGALFAPTDLTANAASDIKIDLAWRDNSDNEDSFVVEKSSNDGAFEVIANLPANTISYSDGLVEVGVSYKYRVKAVSIASGSSAYTNIVSATPVIGLPTAPTYLQADALSTESINLSWVDTSEFEEGFVILRTNNIRSIPFYEVGRTQENIESFVDTGLKSGTVYYYKIYSYNSLGKSSNSLVVKVKTYYCSVWKKLFGSC